MEHLIALAFFALFGSRREDANRAIKAAEGPAVALAGAVARALRDFGTESFDVGEAFVFRLAVAHSILERIGACRERETTKQGKDGNDLQFEQLEAARAPLRGAAQKRRAAEREQMREAIASLQTSEGWQRWLATRRHFRSYSLHNQLLIAVQRPEATRVAGFRAWQTLGYCVRKGERALRIWVPLAPSRKAVEEWKRAGADPGKAPKTRFRLVPVFDRAQVEPLPESANGPAPLEPQHEPISGNRLAALLESLSGFGASIGSEVVFEPIAGAAHGYLEPTSGRIVIDTDPAPARPTPASPP